MALSIPDICDRYGEELQVLEPLFRDFGGRARFSGQVVTLKCFEDNSVVKETLAGDGRGKVLVVDGGGSLRCALLGDVLAGMARDNGWQGVVIYGCVRDVELLGGIELGIRALNVHPLRSNKQGHGQLDAPLRFAGASLATGQHLYADENGIVVAESDLGVDF